MASNITKSPFLRTAAIRGFATQVAPVGGIQEYDVQSSVLSNKIVVSAAENESPISRVSVLFRAGSRNENSDNLGATHVLRIAAGLSCKNASHFSIIRHIQQVGASLSCTADREVVAYTLEGTRRAIEDTLPFLTEVTTRQCFKPWEISDNVPRLKYELASRSPQLRAIDLLHKAAYRSRGLGNSLYIAKHQMGKISSETLQHYVASNFLTNRTAVVGLGVSHDQLSKYAQNLQLESGEGITNSSDYKGGEIRSDKGGEFAHIAIAGQGGALTNGKEALAFAVLQRALGVGPSIKYCRENRGLLSKGVANCASQPFGIGAINISYSDSGLFGVMITTPAEQAAALVNAAVKVLKCGLVSSEDVCRAKKQAATAVLCNMENAYNAIEDMGRQAVLLGCAVSGPQIACALEAVTEQDVNAVAQKLASSRLSMASVGNLKCVPFLDELK